MDEDTPPEDWARNLDNLKNSIKPFLPKFPNLRKAMERVLGDLTGSAIDAFDARLRLSKTRSQTQ